MHGRVIYADELGNDGGIRKPRDVGPDGRLFFQSSVDSLGMRSADHGQWAQAAGWFMSCRTVTQDWCGSGMQECRSPVASPGEFGVYLHTLYLGMYLPR